MENHKFIYPFTAIVGQEKMKKALILNAINPKLGGVLIRGEKGTAKSTAVRSLAALLPEIEVVSGCPFNCDPHEYERLCPECRVKVEQGVSLPITKRKIKIIDLLLGATEEMVLGTLDLEYAVKEDREESEESMSDIPMLETLFPVGDTFKVRRIQMEKDRILRKGSGRRSRTRTSSKAGRYIMSTMHRRSNDLALDATLRAAAPYQQQRRRQDVAIAIEESDIREKIREKRVGNFIVFVVDASGSMGAGKRMIETKGAILSLLMDAYQKRDKVAFVAFKGDRADLLLPPTNSIELAHKLLEELPTGGKTPLCHGISLGYQIIQSYFRKDPNIYPLLILTSDGMANVSQYGGNPLSEAMEMADEIKDDLRVSTAVVDVERSGLISFGLARQLSLRMGARYFGIEDLKADTLVEALREDLLV